MKTLYVLLFAFIGTWTMNAQSEPLQELTEVTFEATSINYGTLSKGADGTRTFVFKNTGSHPLLIEKVFSSSYCKVLSYPKKPIAAGETGEIVVKYDTNKLGPIVKTITVKMNVKEKMVSLGLKGNVVE
jgi:hypothetical protein